MMEMIHAVLLLAYSVLCLGSLQHSPEEELSVYLTVLSERASESTLVLKLTDSLTLSLEKSSVLGDEILLIKDADGSTEYSMVNTSGIQERLYHDPHHQSSLLVQDKDGALHVEGVVNSKLRIKPVPEGPRSSLGQVLHRVYAVTEGDDAYMKMDSRHQSLAKWNPQVPNYGYYGWRPPTWTTKPPTRTSNANLFVVELHVVSCQQHQAHFATNAELIAYLAVMVNAVNMRYLDMVSPQIRFKLVGITRSLTDQFVTKVHGTIHAEVTLQQLSTYYYLGNIAGNPDVVYFVTSQDLAMVQNGAVEKSLLGLAYIGTVCTKRGVAEGEDIAQSYSGVYCMAHELAHSLGSHHDVTAECPWSSGFLMSYIDGGTNKYKLSHCSERQIRTTFRTLSYYCILEASSANYMDYHKALPGQKINEHTYCLWTLKMKTYPAAVTVQKPLQLSSRCKMQCCSRYLCQVVDILEGMSCGGLMTCRRGVCGYHNRALSGR
ncbi:venom metalloproteinase antarease-like TtrivMP_A [Haemaphysalis longicornis]